MAHRRRQASPKSPDIGRVNSPHAPITEHTWARRGGRGGVGREGGRREGVPLSDFACHRRPKNVRRDIDPNAKGAVSDPSPQVMRLLPAPPRPDAHLRA